MEKQNESTQRLIIEIQQIDTRIKKLTLHLQLNPKDYSSQRGLYKILGRRKKLIRYLGFA